MYEGQFILRGNIEPKREKEEKAIRNPVLYYMISSWTGVGPVTILNLKHCYTQMSTTSNLDVYFHIFVQNSLKVKFQKLEH